MNTARRSEVGRLFTPEQYAHHRNRLNGFYCNCQRLPFHRPPVSLHDFYQNAVAFSRDRFLTQSADPQQAPPSAMVITFANHANHPHFLAVADEEGVVHCLNTRLDSPSRGKLASIKVNNNAIFALRFVPGNTGLRCISASGDRNLVLFDCCRMEQMGVFEGHLKSVKCLDIQKDSSGNIFASGGRDGHVMIWDIRSGKIRSNGSQYPTAYLANAHVESDGSYAKNPYSFQTFCRAPDNESINSRKFDLLFGTSTHNVHHTITDLLFQTDRIFLTAGTADCAIRFWDMRMLNSKKAGSFFTIPQMNDAPFTSVCLDETRTTLFASALDRTVSSFHLPPGACWQSEPSASYTGATVSSFYNRCSLSADGHTLACGSFDGKAYLFNVRDPSAQPVVLMGHVKNEVMGVAFNHMDPFQMASYCEDDQVLVWHSEPFLDRSNPADIVGRACLDTRNLEERMPKRSPRSDTVCRSTTQILHSMRKRQQEDGDTPSSHVTPSSPSSGSFSERPDQTPHGESANQRKKRLKNLTLSPFFKARSAS